MRSAESTGDEWPGGSAVRQTTFLDGPNSDGRPVVSDTPKALGPRNCGQSAAVRNQIVAHKNRVARAHGIKPVYSATRTANRRQRRGPIPSYDRQEVGLATRAATALVPLLPNSNRSVHSLAAS